MRVIRAWQQKKRKGFASVQNKGTVPPISACVAHRCDRHENVKPINTNSPELTECGACIADDVSNLLVIYNETVSRLDRACNALDLMSPGSGDTFRPFPTEEPDAEAPKKAKAID